MIKGHLVFEVFLVPPSTYVPSSNCFIMNCLFALIQLLFLSEQSMSMNLARNFRFAALLKNVAVRPERSLGIQVEQFQDFKTLVLSPKPLLTVCLVGLPLQVVNCHSKAKVSTVL